jgi:hypothetical protein
MVNVQIPLLMVERSVADRIQWVYGNLCVLVHATCLGQRLKDYLV